MNPRNITASISALSVAFLCAACTQTNSPVEIQADTAAVEQAVWQKLTQSANEALAKGDKATAEKLYMDALVAAQAQTTESPEAAACMSNLANFYYAQGDGQQADKMYRQAMALKAKLLGQEHIDIAADLIGLGKVCVAGGKYAEAEPLYKRAIDIFKGAEKPVPAETEKEYAEIQAKLSKPAQAKSGGAG